MLLVHLKYILIFPLINQASNFWVWACGFCIEANLFLIVGLCFERKMDVAGGVLVLAALVMSI